MVAFGGEHGLQGGLTDDAGESAAQGPGDDLLNGHGGQVVVAFR